MHQKSAADIVGEVQALSKNKLKMKDDLERLIGLSIKHNCTSVLDETAFKAKYLEGLFAIIQRGETSVEGEVFMRYMNEYRENIEEIRKNLETILEDAGSFIKNIFDEKYLTMTQESISNLNRLIYDLGWYKMYLNDLKNRSL